MFGEIGYLGDCQGWGVLRIDLAAPYETEGYVKQPLDLSNASYYLLMGVNRVVTKAIPAATERVAALCAAGFTPFVWPGLRREHYWVRDDIK